jgi:hypothetical protein
MPARTGNFSFAKFVQQQIHINSWLPLFILINRSSKSTDDEVNRNETSPGKDQISLSMSLCGFGCELHGGAKTA